MKQINIAMFAMLITAVSYGRMAALYPAAASAYTCVGKGLNPHLGFPFGWAMLLDYLVQPLLSAVWIATAVHTRYLPKAKIKWRVSGIETQDRTLQSVTIT